jgi:hypothetical protein
VKTIKYGLAVAVVLGGMSFGAVAQDNPSTTQEPSTSGARPGEPAEKRGARNETMRGFDHWMRQNPDAAEEIRKDPSLLNNSEYMAKHPDLQKFMEDHPDFRRAVKKNPDRVVHKGVHMNKEAREHRREHHERKKDDGTVQKDPEMK